MNGGNAISGNEKTKSDDLDEGRKQPWHFRLTVYVVTGFMSIVLRLWFATLKPTIIGREIEDAALKSGPVIYATWHQGVIYALWYRRDRKLALMASSSKDGEWAAQLVHHFGNAAVRGSSSRDGLKALVEIIRAVKNGVSVGLLPDAPRGPARISKPGALVIAQKTGRPIIPIQFMAEKCFRLKSWDRTMIPMPCSRFVLKYGEPFFVDPNLRGDDFEKRRREFDDAMNNLAEEMDRYFEKQNSEPSAT
ncbi:MAG: lysophospholipid acyltransferase family protein [Planctomycetes bacterium]|nr:lysophospholipid acyltransferase family protein [Planctomycetota bacterium]